MTTDKDHSFLRILNLLGCLLTLTRTVYVQPPSAITYTPPHIETGQYQFGTSTGNIVTANNGDNYLHNHNILFQRVHLNTIKNLKVAVSISGIDYSTTTISDPDYAYLRCRWGGLEDTGFKMGILIQIVPRLNFFKCRYLAVNDVDNTEFHFYQKTSNTFLDYDYTPDRTYYFYQPYTSSLHYSQYKIQYIMTGYDLGRIDPFFYWNSELFAHNQTHIKIALTGRSIRIWYFDFTLLYFKNTIAYNGTTPSFHQTKVLFLQKDQGCWNYGSGFGDCITYDPSLNNPSFKVFQYNYFLGFYDFATNYDLAFYIAVNNQKLDVYQMANGGGIRTIGILFFSLQCPVGSYVDIQLDQCIQCGLNCLKCDSSQCLQCPPNYQYDPNLIDCKPKNVIPKNLQDCINLVYQIDGTYACKSCNLVKKLSLISQTQGCGCKKYYFMNLTSNTCEQICGDGVKIQSECDDNNTKDNDGCDSNCKLQPGFNCNIKGNPTKCKSLFQLSYRIQSITNTEDIQNPSGIILLKPSSKIKLPFDVLKQNFYTNNNFLTQIKFKLMFSQKNEKGITVEKTLDLDFQIKQIKNNEISLIFYYNFTVENLAAQIFLNYSETYYSDSTQTLSFTLKGQNQELRISQIGSQLESIQNNYIAIIVVSLTSLVVGSFLPKFIGLELLLTLQLIFYSQILIYDLHKWPPGFVQFQILKSATGYNQLFNLTNYTQTTIISKKFKKLMLHKTIVQNFNISFVVLVVFFASFYLTTYIRSSLETKIKFLLSQNQKVLNDQKLLLTQLSTKQRKFTKVSYILYCISSQLGLWCMLPLYSTLGTQLMIPNNSVLVDVGYLGDIFLDLRGSQFMLTFSIILSIGFNHFKNIFLSIKTIRKIQQRPEELLYKKSLFIYLTLMGLLIFFHNEDSIFSLPTSVVCLIIQSFYFIFLIKIQPYKQALKVHSVALYLNQFLYFSFLVVINLINLLQEIDEKLVLFLGYYIVGFIYILIMLTAVRLYYQIRYGEALQIKIQAQKKRLKEEQDKKNKQNLKKYANKLQAEAKKVKKQNQKARDFNKFLIQNQQKEAEQMDLLVWLEQKNWQQETKERYYYNKHHQKPLQWVKKKDFEEYEKKMKTMKEQIQKFFKRQEKVVKEQDLELIELKQKMRKNLEQKKLKKKRLKKRQKDEKNNIFCVERAE